MDSEHRNESIFMHTLFMEMLYNGKLSNQQKQPSRGISTKRCSKNIQEI